MRSLDEIENGAPGVLRGYDFGVYWRGDLAEEQVVVRKVEAEPLPPEIVADIDKFWREYTEQAVRDGRRIFDGPTVGLRSLGYSPGRLEIHVAESSYKAYIGVHRNPALLESIDCRYLPNTLACCAAVVLRRDKRLAVIVGKRSRYVAEHAGYWHVVGGSVEPDAALTPFEAMRIEIREELGLPDDRLIALRCLGLVVPDENRKPELVFRADVDMDAGDLMRNNIGSARDRYEHDEIEAVPLDDRELLERYILNKRMAPSGRAALTLAGGCCRQGNGNGAAGWKYDLDWVLGSLDRQRRLAGNERLAASPLFER